jgi:hypothetical protein
MLSLTSLLSAPEREVTSPSDFKVVGALKTTLNWKLMTGYDLFLRPYHFRDKHNFLSDPHAIKITTFAFIF